MTWPIPTPAQLFSSAAVVYESTFIGIDARSANSVASTNCRIVAMTAYDLYLYQSDLSQELMPDTAVSWLPRHANIWNVPQLLPTPATGNAIFTGAPGTPIPAGVTMTAPAGALYLTTAAGTIGTGSNVSVPITSALGGSIYNLPAGTTMALVSPIDGLTQQAGVLDSDGAANGTDLESTDNWRSRILAKIRKPPQGGCGNDYLEWVQAAGAPLVGVVPGAIGAGSVGIYIAAAGPTAASSQLVAAVQAYLGAYNTPNGVRPVTARVVVAAATLVPVPVTLQLNPNTAQTQAAALAALQLFFAQNPQSTPGSLALNAPIKVSRLDNAVSNADGEFSHERILPATDVTCLASQILVLGTVTFE